MQLSRQRFAQLLAGAATLAVLTLLVIGGLIKPGYSHSANFISELNATGSPHAASIGLFGFLPLGLLLAAFILAAAPLVLVHGLSRVGYWLLLSQPIAYIGVFAFPCDLGCPIKGSATQQVHNLLAVVTYVAGAVGFLLLSRSRALEGNSLARFWLVGVGVLWLLGIFAMVEPSFAAWRGLLQRALEATLYASVLFIAYRMLPPPR